MRIKEASKLALNGIRTNPLRAFLTSLGVVIGVAAVIIIIAIGEGARAEVVSSIEGLGSNILFVMPGEEKQVSSPRQTPVLDNSVLEELIRTVPLIEAAAGEVSRGGVAVKYGKVSLNASIIGATGNYIDVRDYEIVKGRGFSEEEIRSGDRICLITDDMATDLFEGGEPVGKQVNISGTTYRVAGTYKAMEIGFFRAMTGIRMDQVLLPITTVQRRMTGNDELSTIYISVDEAKNMAAAQKAVEKTLLAKMGFVENFNVANQADILDTLSTITGTLTSLLAGIAAVSLVVGGIGIMNIMLVSVTERIREIGIRKALGATRKDILAQFLMEAVIISFTGGAVGTILGLGIAYLVSSLAGWPGLIPWYSVALALTFSIGIGLFFGVYPANKAAALQPVDALRYE